MAHPVEQVTCIALTAIKQTQQEATFMRTIRPGNVLTEKKILRTRNKKRVLKNNSLIQALRKLSDAEELGNYEQIVTNSIWDAVRETKRVCSSSDNSQSPEYDLENIVDLKFPRCNRHAIEQIHKRRTENAQLFRTNISAKEIRNAIDETLDKTYTGAEGICFRLIKCTLGSMIHIIDIIARMSFATGHCPRTLTITKGCIIPKKAAGKYRIVHIPCILMAILERIALHRLEYSLEHHNLLNNNQFGFTPNRGRHDLLARCLELISFEKTRNKDNHFVTIIGLDIEGAFDNVDQNLLAQKLDELLPNNSITTWLLDYLLNREIYITYEGKSSKTNQVSKGVPQGSALGPILWNLVIHEIDAAIKRRQPNTQISSHDKTSSYTELLAYADDLVIVQIGRHTNALQNALNNVQHTLELNNLKISTSKSTIMFISSSRHRPHKSEIQIQGATIPQVKTTRILGTPLTHTTRLDCKDKEMITKILLTARTLKRIRALKIINTNRHWQVVTSSMLQSVVIDNHLPLLCIDGKSRRWCDKVMMCTHKYVHGWARVVPNKIVYLITKQPTAKELCDKYLAKNTTRQFHHTFNNLALLSQSDQSISTPKITLFTANKITKKRALFNIPGSNTRTQYITASLEWMSHEPKLMYFTIEVGNAAMLITMSRSDSVSEVTTISHAQSNNTYFHGLAALNYVATKHTPLQHNQRTVIIMSKVSSTLQAVCNPKNHDWRVVSLNRKMYAKRLQVAAADQEDIETALAHIHVAKPTIVSSNWPPNSDYIIRHRKLTSLAKTAQAERLAQQTCVTRAINPDPEDWSRISPSLLQTCHLLALSNLVIINTGKTVHADTHCLPNDFRLKCCKKPPDAIGERNTLLHALFECQEAHTLITCRPNDEDRPWVYRKCLTTRREQVELLATIKRLFDQSDSGNN